MAATLHSIGVSSLEKKRNMKTELDRRKKQEKIVANRCDATDRRERNIFIFCWLSKINKCEC